MEVRSLVMRGTPAQVLLVEDDEVDVMAVERAFASHELPNELVVAHDGVDALRVLRSEDPSRILCEPFIVLLDLNMPRMNGLELLRELRADRVLRRVVVFVLTTSDAERDIEAAYDANVAGYILKSSLGRSLTELIDLIRPYCGTVQLPRLARGEGAARL